MNPGEGLIPYNMGYIGMCSPKGYGFSAILVINRVWFLHSSLELFKVINRVGKIVVFGHK